MKLFSIISLLLCLPIILKAQMEENLVYGVKVGIAHSRINNINQVIYPEKQWSGYTFNEKGTTGLILSGFVNYRFSESRMSITPEVSFAQLGTQYDYKEQPRANQTVGLQHKTKLKFNYINLALMFRLYLYQGLFATLGPQINFILNPSDLTYNSNANEMPNFPFPDDLAQRDYIKNILQGRSQFGFNTGIGYEFDFGLLMDLRFFLGLSDAIQKYSSNLGQVGNPFNQAQHFYFTIGYNLPFDKRNF